MVLTPSDIGTSPENVERNLTKMFKRAMSWQTVLLIDEADVFMERRSTSDLLRNSLVAGTLIKAFDFPRRYTVLTSCRLSTRAGEL